MFDYKKYRILFLITVFIVSTTFTQGKSKANDIIIKANNFYSKLKSAQISFEQTNLDLKNSSLKGSMLYQTGNKYSLKIGNSLIVSDGLKVNNYNYSQKKVIISKANAKKNNFTPNDLFTILSGDIKAELLKETNEIIKVKFKPQLDKNSSLNISNAVLTINKKNNTFNEIEFYSNVVGNLRIKFLSAKYDIKIPEDKFKLVIPNGFQVIDLTK